MFNFLFDEIFSYANFHLISVFIFIFSILVFKFIFIFICLFGPAPTSYRIPRLGFKSELYVLGFATATTPDLSHICDLHHSSGKLARPRMEPTS